MGKIMENCWLFSDDQTVWAVCVDCMKKGLEREEYWIKVVPTDKFPSFDDFRRKISLGPIKVLCNAKKHEIVISRVWFSRKKMKKP
jgi:hypothetical protein